MKIINVTVVSKLASIVFGAILVAIFFVPFLRNNAAENLDAMLPTTPTLTSVINLEVSCSINGQSITTFHNTSTSVATLQRFDVGDPTLRAALEKQNSSAKLFFFDRQSPLEINNVVNLPILDAPHSCELMDTFDLENSDGKIVPARCEFITSEGPIEFNSTCSISIISVRDCSIDPWDGWGCSESTIEQRQKRRNSDEAAWQAYQIINK